MAVARHRGGPSGGGSSRGVEEGRQGEGGDDIALEDGKEEDEVIGICW